MVSSNDNTSSKTRKCLIIGGKTYNNPDAVNKLFQLDTTSTEAVADLLREIDDIDSTVTVLYHLLTTKYDYHTSVEMIDTVFNTMKELTDSEFIDAFNNKQNQYQQAILGTLVHHCMFRELEACMINGVIPYINFLQVILAPDAYSTSCADLCTTSHKYVRCICTIQNIIGQLASMKTFLEKKHGITLPSKAYALTDDYKQILLRRYYTILGECCGQSETYRFNTIQRMWSLIDQLRS